MILLCNDVYDDVYDNVVVKEWIAVEILKGLLEHAMD